MKPYNFCPNCGIDVKNTGFEDFGCWSCGQSMVTDGNPTPPASNASRIDKREQFIHRLNQKISQYGLADTFYDMLLRMPPGAYELLKSKMTEYEIYSGMFIEEDNDQYHSHHSGTTLIATERKRQIVVEGFNADHDNLHFYGELAYAAIAYALVEEYYTSIRDSNGSSQISLSRSDFWPWKDKSGFKPKAYDADSGDVTTTSNDWVGNRIYDLVKAGALIAAEIDRLQRIFWDNAKPSYEATTEND